MGTTIAYYRVSTKQQQRSGLGIEAQRAAAQRFAEAEGLHITAEYVEAETGKGSDALERRPQLRCAGRHKGRQVQRARLQARPVVPRRRVHRRPYGSARAI